jgi:hypothetical protein
MTHSGRLAECEEFKNRLEKFMDESTREGGFRSRVAQLEIKVSYIEKAVLKNAILGGIIGALIGSGASPAIIQVVDFFLKIHQ